MSEQNPRGSKGWEEWTRRVLDELANLNASQECIAKEIEAFKKDANKKLDDMSHILVGNGDPSKGVTFRLTMVEDNQTKFDEFIKKDEDRRTWLFRTAIAACLTAVVSLIVAVGKYFITN